MPICWICLDGPGLDSPLTHPCKCPSMAAHSRCVFTNAPPAASPLQRAHARRNRRPQVPGALAAAERGHTVSPAPKHATCCSATPLPHKPARLTARRPPRLTRTYRFTLPLPLRSLHRRRERFCDFCSSELPDWKDVLTPCPGVTAPAVMNVNFDNKTYSFQARRGAGAQGC